MPQPGEDLAGTAGRLAALGEAGDGELVAEEDVLGDAEAVDDVEFLVHRGDAELQRGDRIRDDDGLAADRHGAGIGLVGAGENLDERGLPGTVLAEQAVHLAGDDVEIHAVQGLRPGEVLHDAPEAEQRSRGVGSDHASNVSPLLTTVKQKYVNVSANVVYAAPKVRWAAEAADPDQRKGAIVVTDRSVDRDRDGRDFVAMQLTGAPESRTGGPGRRHRRVVPAPPRRRAPDPRRPDRDDRAGPVHLGGRIDLLLDAGLVAPAGGAGSTGGRPPATFAFNPTSRVVLAVDLGATHARLALTDLASKVLAAHQAPLLIADGPDHVLDWVGAHGERLLAEAGRAVTDLIGIGVGLPGPVEHATGRPTNPPIMPGWDDADVRGILAPRVRLRRAGRQRRQHHGSRRAPHRLEGRRRTCSSSNSPPVSVPGSSPTANSAAGPRAPPATSGTSPCPTAATRCAGAATPAAWRRSPAVRPSPTPCPPTGFAARNGSDVVALVRAGDLRASLAVRQAGRRIGAC